MLLPGARKAASGYALAPKAFKSSTGNAGVAHGHGGIPMAEKILENAKIGPAVS